MAIKATLSERSNDPAAPASDAAAITPHEVNELEAVTRGIYVGGAGNIVLITATGRTVTFTNVPAGSILPIAVRQVKAIGTTATALVALW